MYFFGVGYQEIKYDWLDEYKFSKVTDKQAIEWFETDAEGWAVVVKLWVLVQGISTA